MIISLNIDGVDYTPNLILPIKLNSLLDERLDEGRISLRNTTVSLFRIGAHVKIWIDHQRIDFIISADQSTELPPGSGKYNHELAIIEPTKILEGIMCESLTFKRALGRTYNMKSIKAPTYWYMQNGKYEWVDGRYIDTPTEGDDTSKASIHSMYTPFDGSQAFVVNAINKQITTENGGSLIKWNVFNKPSDSDCPLLIAISPSGKRYEERSYETDITIANPEQGAWTLNYNYCYHGEGNVTTVNRIEYQVFVVKNMQPKEQYTITDVIKRVLKLCEPHLAGDQPRFSLDLSQSAEFNNIIAPEFAFTNMTLKEILDQIGGFIHGVPRLVADSLQKLTKIQFDMLGGVNSVSAEFIEKSYLSQTMEQSIESYATELDSIADNLVNTLNNNEGAIIEPYGNGAKSVRSEEAYARIEEKNMVISTTLPIYKIHKLEIIRDSGAYDITSFVYEGADYGRLSSYTTDFVSKAFAIYYNLGERNVKGLAFKTPNIFGNAVANYSIANIIKFATGEDISSEWWDGSGDEDSNYPQLTFRITYTPIFSTRVLQHKSNIKRGDFDRTLAYNQSANLVETKYYGENMKGVIARSGNVELVRTYRLTDISLLPKIGELYERDDGDYYVSSLTLAIYNNCVDATIGFSRDFNRLSQYIGVNSEWRAYEVDNRIAYRREIAYKDYCIFDFENDKDDDWDYWEKRTVGCKLIDSVRNVFYKYDDFEIPRLTCAVVKTIEDDDTQNVVTLPIISTAFGNSLVFSFGMEDNFSAGAQSALEKSGNSIKGYWNTDTPYCDYYGRVKYVAYYLGGDGVKIGAGTQGAFNLPSGDYGGENSFVEALTVNPLVVDKNNAETLKFSYHLQFVALDNSLIIGPALTNNNQTIGGNPTTATLYVLTERIGKFDTRIEIPSGPSGGIPQVLNSGWRAESIYRYFPIVYAPRAGKSWAIVDQDGNILLARNVEIKNGEQIKLPRFYISHKIPEPIQGEEPIPSPDPDPGPNPNPTPNPTPDVPIYSDELLVKFYDTDDWDHPQGTNKPLMEIVDPRWKDPPYSRLKENTEIILMPGNIKYTCYIADNMNSWVGDIPPTKYILNKAENDSSAWSFGSGAFKDAATSGNIVTITFKEKTN